MNGNAYYIDTFCESRPLEGYGMQFKEYLDNALSGASVEISAVTESIQQVDEHLTDVIINVEGNLAAVAEQVQTNLAGVIVNSQNELTNHITNSKNEIISNDNTNKDEIIEKINEIETTSCGGISKNDLDEAVNTIVAEISNVNDNVSNSKNEIINNASSNKEEVIQSVISVQDDATVKITATIKTESEKAQERLEQIRQELINAINNTNSIVELGFTDLNEEVIASKNEIIKEVHESGESIYITGGDVEE